MNHRMSNHFMEFMQTSGPFMTGDVDLLEYRSLYPSPVRLFLDPMPHRVRLFVFSLIDSDIHFFQNVSRVRTSGGSRPERG